MRCTLAVLSVLASSSLLAAQAAWTRLYPPQSPPPRRDALMACYEPLGETLLLFGTTPQTQHGDCWRYDGTTWSQVIAALPLQRIGGAMVYDSSRQRIVLFGGMGSSNYLQDTWEWNGSLWQALNPAVKPATRSGHGMAFDRRRGVSVVFAGSAGPGVDRPDLWEWNGTAWTQRTPAVMPAVRMYCLMSFDPANDSVLMTGGYVQGPGTPLSETWSWDGATWTLRQPATPPLPHVTGRLVADLHRRRVLMFGDSNDMFAWEWDGAEWTMRLQVSPGNREQPAMAYDPVHRRTVLFGGASALGDTWVFRTPNPADVVPYGTGCTGAGGVPQLANAPYSYPWLGDTFTSRVSRLAPTAQFAVFVTGFQSTAPISLALFGMPGCVQLVGLIATELRLGTGGSVDWSLAIPNTPSLLNVRLFQQAFAPDATANALGLTASNGIQVSTGIR